MCFLSDMELAKQHFPLRPDESAIHSGAHRSQSACLLSVYRDFLHPARFGEAFAKCMFVYNSFFPGLFACSTSSCTCTTVDDVTDDSLEARSPCPPFTIVYVSCVVHESTDTQTHRHTDTQTTNTQTATRLVLRLIGSSAVQSPPWWVAQAAGQQS
jgi:hypothetical protein